MNFQSPCKILPQHSISIDKNIWFSFLNFSGSFGYRSPSFSITGGSGNSAAGNTSPSQGGRTMREHNEQLNTLRKENFNLKLRIYFLEEKNTADGSSDSLYKQNIDLKVSPFAIIHDD